MTFHSFGLDVIGRATGEKPRLAPWLEAGGDVKMVQRIVDELRDASPDFRVKWDLYRLVLARVPSSLDEGEPDGYDPTTKRTGWRTLAGEVVKSHGERLIADFLHLNGVRYRYEHPYRFPVYDAAHSQYRPDFYYPTSTPGTSTGPSGATGNLPPSSLATPRTWRGSATSMPGTERRSSRPPSPRSSSPTAWPASATS